MFRSVRQWLEARDEDWFEGNFSGFGKAQGEISQRQQSAWMSEAKRFHENICAWYQAGLGRPELLADFGYWSKMARYEVFELTLLSMGLEPVEKFQERFDQQKMKRRRVTSADKFAMRRYELFRREFAPNSRNGTVFPNDLVCWMRAVCLDAHPSFLRMIDTLEARHSTEREAKRTATGAQSPDNNRPPDNREVVSLAKLITAIAIEEYGYRSGSRRSPIPKEIEAITDRHGISVSHDTVRKYLQMGSRYLPKDGV